MCIILIILYFSPVELGNLSTSESFPGEDSSGSNRASFRKLNVEKRKNTLDISSLKFVFLLFLDSSFPVGLRSTVNRSEENFQVGSSGVYISKRCMTFGAKSTTTPVNETLTDSITLHNVGDGKVNVSVSFEQSESYELSMIAEMPIVLKKRDRTNIAFQLTLKKTCNLFKEVNIEICE